MDEYEYIDENEFIDLIICLLYKEIGKRYLTGVIYEDSIIKIFARYSYNANFKVNEHPQMYRVDRKKFLNSSNPDLKDYKNIIFSFGKDNNFVARYSREVGYIVPHIRKMINDEDYNIQEKFMYVLEN
jgi:hypothetical protein